MARFPLAPMKGLILWLTIVVLPLPLLLLWLGRSPLPWVLWLAAAFIAACYTFVWLYMRPKYFEVSQKGLEIVWPLRRLSQPIDEIESVESLEGKEFRARYGYGMRIGAGGLWGGFGLLATRKETFQFYISRMDGYVIVRRGSQRPLLITPEDPKRFVRTLEGFLAP